MDTYKRKYVYKTLKNLLVNEWGLTKEIVLDMVNNYVEKAVVSYLQHHYFSQINVDRKIMRLVSDIVENGRIVNYPFLSRDSFENMVQRALEKAIADRVTISIKRDVDAIKVTVKEKQ
jgi:hypothetical protein